MKTKLNLVALVLLTFIFASCDSLWQVGESTDVSMSINLRDIAGGSLFLGDDDDGFDEEFNSGNYTSFDIVVSLHNAANNSIIDSQTEKNTPSDSTGDIVFTFKAVSINLEAYASVHIYGNATGGERTLIFRAQSNDTIIKTGKNNIVARPNLLFYNGSVLAYIKGSDKSIGITDGVDMLDKALTALGGRNNLAPNATVLMDVGIMISYETKFDCAGLTLSAVAPTQLLYITTSNIHISNLVLIGIDNNSNALITVGSGMGPAENTILTNIVIKDNTTGSYGGAGLYNNQGVITMNNCTISENTSDGNGAGINNEGTLTMNNCTISGNTAAGNGGGVYTTGSLTLFGCTIIGNHAENQGGGLFTDEFSGGNSSKSDSIIINNTDGDMDPSTDPNEYGSF